MNSALKPLVLIVEDEAALVTLLRYNLEKEGFRVAAARRRRGSACCWRRSRSPDLVLLDWMLPLMSGIEVCRQMRRKPETRDMPIIMLTARGEEADKRARPRHRRRRLRRQAVLARPNWSPACAPCCAAPSPGLADETAAASAIVIMDLAAHRVRRQGRDVHLGPTEFRLLRHFMEHPGRVFSASSCSMRSGATTSMSSRARSTSISAACARR